MLELTATQLTQILQLHKNPLISFASVSVHKSGYTHLTISSEPDADWTLVALELSYIFPDIQIDRKQVDDGPVTYDVEVGEGIVVYLMMNESPVEEVWTIGRYSPSGGLMLEKTDSIPKTKKNLCSLSQTLY